MNNSLIISANSHERLFGESKTRPSRPAQLTLFNNQSAQAKPFSSKQKSSNINQLPGIHSIDLSLEYSSVLSDVRPMHFALIDIWQKSLQNLKFFLVYWILDHSLLWRGVAEWHETAIKSELKLENMQIILDYIWRQQLQIFFNDATALCFISLSPILMVGGIY